MVKGKLTLRTELEGEVRFSQLWYRGNIIEMDTKLIQRWEIR